MTNLFLTKLARAYLWAYSTLLLSVLAVLVRRHIIDSKTRREEHRKALQQPTPPLYTTLRKNRIRLLKLLPGNPGQPIFATLSEASNWRSGYDTYEALSYVWGKTENPKQHKHSIVLNGQVFPVSSNLHEALQHLRQPSQPRVLYVDALCINQSDASERDSQIAMLGDVYRSASRVVAWLGPSSPATALGFELLSFIFGAEELLASPPWTRHPVKKIRAALDDVLGREYFSRMWVVQENALALRLTLQSSSHTLTWLAGAETHRAITRLKFLSISPAWEDLGLADVDFRPLLEMLEQNMMVSRLRSGRACRPVTILDLAYDLRCRKATDRRDMLFALRNMVPDSVKEGIKVDYSGPVADLYMDFFEGIKGIYEAEMDFVAKEVEEVRKVEERERLRYSGGW